MKRVIALLLSFAAILSALLPLAGCSGEKVHVYTRGEWISKLADTFGLDGSDIKDPLFSDVKQGSEYFGAVQACAAWEIIETGDKFEPDKVADVNFAIVTAVKAVGIDRISNSVGGKELKTDEEMIEYFKSNSDVKYISGSSLYSDTAEQIIEDTNKIYSSLRFEQKNEINFSDKVVYPETQDVIFSADGKTATVRNGSYNVGDIICFLPSASYPSGKYAKVTEVNGDTIVYTAPTLDEIAESVNISGTFEPEILGVIPLTDGVEVESIEGSETGPQAYNAGNESGIIYVRQNGGKLKASPIEKISGSQGIDDININVDKTFKIGSAEVTVEGKIRLTDLLMSINLETGTLGIKSFGFTLSDKIIADLSVTGKISQTIDLVKVPCNVYGVAITFVVSVKIGVEGTVAVVCSAESTQGIEQKISPLPIIFAPPPKFIHTPGKASIDDLSLSVKGYIRPTFDCTLSFLSVDLASTGVYSGLEASAKVKLISSDDDEGCVDVSTYVPLVIYVKAGLGDIASKKWSWDIWNSKNSPVKKTLHIEKGKTVPECTRTNKKPDDDETDVEGGSSVDEELIDHMSGMDSYLVISSFYVVLDEGSSDTLKVDVLPDGYSMSDIVFTSSDQTVASVGSDGVIKGNKLGSCVITVSTKDGKFKCCCSVRVLASYDVEFTPLSYAFENEIGISQKIKRV